MRLGIQLGLEHVTISSLQEAWQRIDSMPVDTMWTWDHFFPIHGDPTGAHYECWTILSAMAATTTRVELGPLVSCSSFRNAGLVSRMSTTLDHLSHGRFCLGLGAGWYRRDFDEYNYDWGSAGRRLMEMERLLKIIKLRWSIDRPRSARPIPILIGAGGSKVGLRLVAQHADTWNWFGPLEAYMAKLKVLEDWCDKVGRNPIDLERSVTLYDRSELAYLDEYAALGVEHVIFGLREPWDWAAADQLIDWATNATRRS